MNLREIINIRDTIRLEQTCGGYPEQYEAFIGEEQVGYLRLRHGFFRVDVPDCGGETIYQTSKSEGDGIFADHERDFFLDEAKNAIAVWLYEQMDNTKVDEE